MSGLCALVNFDGAPVDADVLQAMTETCASRGPDGIHYWINGNVGLAHLALHATPEAQREHQPLLSPDGRLCLAADARVDNRPELIHLLAAKGFLPIDDPTDADLILAAYNCWGADCPQQIIGDFAFAIWDAPRQRLFCARDALGLKTLYYSHIGANLCVASEAQMILQHPGVPRRLDEAAAADFLVAASWDEARSMFLDVHGLPQANSLTASASGIRLERYWDIDPDFRTRHKSDAEYGSHFLEIFERAVVDRLRTPAPTVGINMSGGLDSTSVAAVARRYLVRQDDHPHLVACSYAYEQLKECDERAYSRLMASGPGIELIYIPAENFWYLDDDEAYTPSLETPFMTEESRSRYILKLLQARGAGVWLTGHGGDSMLTGSPTVCADNLQRGDLSAIWKTARYWRTRRRPPANLLRAYRDWFIKPLIPLSLKRALKPAKKPVVSDWLAEDFVSRTGLVERLSRPPGPARFSDRARQENYPAMALVKNILPTIRWADRLAAQFHMEARHPFLDRRLVTFLLSIPQEQIFHYGSRKYILRTAMKGILPETIRTRTTKTEFSSDIALGLKQKESAKVMAHLAISLQNHYNIFHSVNLKNSYQRYLEGTEELSINRLWRAIALGLWLQKYF